MEYAAPRATRGCSAVPVPTRDANRRPLAHPAGRRSSKWTGIGAESGQRCAWTKNAARAAWFHHSADLLLDFRLRALGHALVMPDRIIRAAWPLVALWLFGKCPRAPEGRARAQGRCGRCWAGWGRVAGLALGSPESWLPRRRWPPNVAAVAAVRHKQDQDAQPALRAAPPSPRRVSTPAMSQYRWPPRLSCPPPPEPPPARHCRRALARLAQPAACHTRAPRCRTCRTWRRCSTCPATRRAKCLGWASPSSSAFAASLACTAGHIVR